VEYIALNTDAQALKNNMADLTIQVGSNLTSALAPVRAPKLAVKPWKRTATSWMRRSIRPI
jgi:cell division GTPase FtsZ